MSVLDEMRRIFKGAFETRQPIRPQDRGLLGDGQGNLWVAEDSDPRVWFRKNGQSSQLVKVYCWKCRPIYDLPVICGYAVEQPTFYQVLDWDRTILESAWNGMSSVPRHAEMHTWADTLGGDDPVMVWTRAFMPFRVSPQETPDLTVQVEGPEMYLYGASWTRWAGQVIYNLAGSYPAAGFHCFALVSIDGATNTLQVTVGGAVLIAFPIPPGSYPTPPAASIPLALVHLETSAGGVSQPVEEADVLDARVIVSSGGGCLTPAPHHFVDTSVHDDTEAYVAPTQGDVLRFDTDWEKLAIGGAHTIYKVNAAGTLPIWAAFDWDEISVAAGADVAHDHSAAAEGDQNLRQILELEFQDAALLTINAGTVTRTQVYHVIAAEAGVADNLDNVLGGVEGDELIIRPDAGDTITCRHNQGGAGDFWFAGGANVALDNEDHLRCVCDVNGRWCDQSGGAGGGGTLDQAYDFGGAGAGRTITADAGAVQLNNVGGLGSQGPIVLDDGAGDSPELQFVGGSNDDTAHIFLDDDAVAGDSDLIVQLPGGDASLSQLDIQDAVGNSILQVAANQTITVPQAEVYIDNGLFQVIKLLLPPAIIGIIVTVTTSAVEVVQQLYHWCTGVPAAGFGGRLLWELDDTVGRDDAGAIDVTWADPNDGSEDSYFSFLVRVAGAALAEVARIDRYGIYREQLLTNGGHEIWQRGAGAFTTTTAYAADRWQLIIAGTDTLSISQDGANKKTNSQYASACTFVLGNGAGATQYRQALVISDQCHGLLGQTISLRIPVKLSAGVVSAIRSFITTDGTGGTTIYSGYHGNNTNWEDLDVIVTVPSDATYIRVGVAFAASCMAYVDNCMLIIGTASVNYCALPPDKEWERCQRYYEIHGGVANTIQVYQNNGIINEYILDTYRFLTRKAIVPTITKSGAWNVALVPQPVADSPTVTGYRIYAGVSTGAGMQQFVTDSADDLVTAEANP